MRRTRAWLWALAVGVVVVGVYVLVPLSDLSRYVMFMGVQVGAVAATVVGVRWHRPQGAGPWLGFGTAAALGLLAAVFHGWQVASGQEWAFPTPADLLFLLMFVPIVWSLLAVQRARTPGRDTAALIDACISTLALSVVGVAFVVPGPTLATLEPLRVIQPMLDVLALGVIVRVAFDGGSRHPTMVLGAAAVLSLVIADVVELGYRLQGTEPPAMVTVGLLIGGVLWTASTLHPSMRTATEPAPTSAHASESRPRLLLLASAALLLPVLQVTLPWHGRQLAVGVAGWGSAAMVTLVLARLALLVRAQRRTAALRSELDRRRADTRLAVLVEHSSDVVLLLDGSGHVAYATPSLERALGYREHEVVGRPLADLLDGDRATVDAQIRLLTQMPAARTERIEDYRIGHRDGTERTFEVLATNLLDHPDVGCVVLHGRDVTEHRRLEDQLRRQALMDPLTGLANRTLLTDRVGHALVTRRRRPGTQVGILFIDLDDFKTVNDSLGHAAGDELLVTVADRLRGSVRMQDTVARLGGDEFAVLVADADVMTAAEEVADRILAAVAEPVLLEDRHVRVTASIGIAATTVDSWPPADDLLRQADMAMYAVKTSGKGGRTHFALDMHEQALRRLDLMSDLESALDGGQFTLVYQPVIDLGAGDRIIGAEALVRWDHPRHGRISPNEFINLAEETGAIVPLGRWVLHRACRQLAEWRSAHPAGPTLSVAVNVSAHQLRHAGFVTDVAAALTATAVPPAALTLELTESALVDDSESTVAVLAELRALGVRIAVDDFGTGYSSLSYLNRFPIDVLKIDKSFVDQLAPDAAASLTRGVLSMAALLRVATVAEGIETAEQLSVLRDLRCAYGQGYLFDRPLEPAAFWERIVPRGTSDEPAELTGTAA